ncbi:DNA polymerase IV [Sutterella sp.]|uniref:DNA polymerase IV n=1 Tax=Sutterella sp. TaxID=1981025 RepID=UPI0026E04751|nr:DNA polymerase IV [Sutterella sp.]MDO5531649.1 DNA polymerase IV [Sutterella sp.]
MFQNDLSRRIVHVDMDAFFASVEQRDRPELRGKPIAVGHAERRGVVATASYEARRFGVHSAMPSSRAKQLCPELIFVEGRMAHYREISAAIREIFERYTDLVEPLSIDEAFLDVTDNKLGLEYGTEVARRIKMDIRRELSLTASAGVSYNKFLAKIASDWRKPDGIFTIHPTRAQEFIDALPIEAFWGVGPATAKRFHEMGISTGYALRMRSFTELTDRFGAAGALFYKFARGIDSRPVKTSRVRKSVGCEETFLDDIAGFEALSERMAGIAADLTRRISRHDFRGRTITLKIRFADFTTKTRSMTALVPYVAEPAILEAGMKLLSGIEIPPEGVRLLGLSVSSPESGTGAAEATLFESIE